MYVDEQGLQVIVLLVVGWERVVCADDGGEEFGYVVGRARADVTRLDGRMCQIWAHVTEANEVLNQVASPRDYGAANEPHVHFLEKRPLGVIQGDGGTEWRTADNRIAASKTLQVGHHLRQAVHVSSSRSTIAERGLKLLENREDELQRWNAACEDLNGALQSGHVSGNSMQKEPEPRQGNARQIFGVLVLVNRQLS
jgi:hypothetical protein